MRRYIPFIFSAGLLVSCGLGGETPADEVQNAKVELADTNDSVSYAVGMVVGQGIPRDMAELGVDSTTLDAFLRGMSAVFPADDSPEAIAYANGVAVGVEFRRMLDMANEAVYPDDDTRSLAETKYLEGLKAAACQNGGVMTTEEAEEYYYETTFRSRSEEFIRNNIGRPGVVVLPSGVQYKIEKMGTGVVASENDIVRLDYKGSFPNGAVFASTNGEPADFNVGSLVRGLAQAVTTLPAGTKCMVYIPWDLAYGRLGSSGIPPYSAIVFDVEIVAVVRNQ